MNKRAQLKHVGVALAIAAVGIIGSGPPLAGAAPGDALWTDVARPAGFQPVQHVEDSTTDSAGNVYVTGEIGNQGTGAPNSDVMVAKYSSNGTLLWSTRYGTPNSDAGHGISVTPDGATVAVAADFGGLYQGPNLADATFTRTRVVPNGQLQTGWTVATFDGASGAGRWLEGWDNATVDGFAQDIAIESSGTIFVTGHGGQPWTSYLIPPAPGCNPRVESCSSTTVPYFPSVPECTACVGVLTAVLSPAGDPVAAHIVRPGGSTTVAFAGLAAGAGSLWYSGECGCSNLASSIMPDSTERAPAWVARYSMAAMSDPTTPVHATWVRQFGSWVGFNADEPTDIEHDLVVDGADNVYVAGERRSNGFVKSFDSTGTSRWDIPFGDPAARDTANDVAIDNWGNVFVTGTTFGSIPGASEPNQGGADAFVAQLRRADGATGWRHQYGTSTDEGAVAISATGQRVTIAGFANANLASTGLVFNVSGLVRSYENDLVAPVITLTTPPVSPTTYELGSTVGASWSCTDPGAGATPPTGSGLAAPCSATTANGAAIDTALPVGMKNYSVGPATDFAGNTTPALNTTYSIVDTTSPTVTISAPTTGATYRVGDPAPVTNFQCTDLDLVADTFPDGPIDGCVGALFDTSTTSATAIADGSNLSTAAAGSFSVRVTGLDHSGNITVRSVSYSVVGGAKPTIVAAATSAPNGAGWYNGDVTVHFTCTAGGSAIPVGACPADQVLTGEGSAVASTAQTVTDAVGNTSDPSNVVTVEIDRHAPTLAPTVSPNPVLLNGVATGTSGASDALSGLASSSCGVPLTGTVGTKTLYCTARDVAGNTRVVTTDYRVTYRFDGFMQPINDTAHTLNCGSPCVASIFKGGSTVPVKFQLRDANGVVVQSASAPVWLTPAKGVATTAAVDESVYTLAANTGGTYLWDGTQYSYNWKTKGVAVGFFWRVGVALDDGQTYTVNIGLK